jgi:C4-dicarboxylate-specific signal transduction histidine kinase
MAENDELARLQDISRRLAELHVRVQGRFAELNARQRALLEEVTRRRDERRMAEIRKSLDGSVQA